MYPQKHVASGLSALSGIGVYVITVQPEALEFREELNYEEFMRKGRVPWWMFLIAGIYVATFAFNARQEFGGPANTGWVPSWPAARVAAVSPGRPMERAGVRGGDIIIAADRQPLTGMPDWFVARAHFELNQPIDLRIRRGGVPHSLQLVINEPAWHTWNELQFVQVLAFYFVRLILLLLAIYIGFSRSQRFRASLVALMLAVGSVAEGYPSSGWAAGLSHLPAVLAVPIGLATASCLLAPLLWLAFFADFASFRLSQKWRRFLVFAPGVIFGLPIISSAVALIYSPEVLSRPWSQVLSAAPVGLIQDTAGVSPLLFLNVVPGYRPGVQVGLLEGWCGVSIVYLLAGSVMLAAASRRISDPQERRRLTALCLAVLLFGVVAIQNVFERNWANWLGTPSPILFAAPVSIGMDFLFLIVPLTLVYYVLTEDGRTGEGNSNTSCGV